MQEIHREFSSEESCDEMGEGAGKEQAENQRRITTANLCHHITEALQWKPHHAVMVQM